MGSNAGFPSHPNTQAFYFAVNLIIFEFASFYFFNFTRDYV